METGSDWAQRPVRSQDLRCFNVERVPELPGSFLHCSVRWNNASFTMPTHPDVGEGASPLPVRPGRAFLLRAAARSFASPLPFLLIFLAPGRSFRLAMVWTEIIGYRRNELLMPITVFPARVHCQRFLLRRRFPSNEAAKESHEEHPQ